MTCGCWVPRSRPTSSRILSPCVQSLSLLQGGAAALCPDAARGARTGHAASGGPRAPRGCSVPTKVLIAHLVDLEVRSQCTA